MRLARVYVENLDYRQFIPRFDRPETFFYLDPSYYGFEGCYGDGIFRREDFQNLRDRLAAVKMRVPLSKSREAGWFRPAIPSKGLEDLP
jgi:DNA adenine methylase